MSWNIASSAWQKDPEDPDSDIRFVRVLKNRFSGAIGDAGTLLYNRETGRLQELNCRFSPLIKRTSAE